MAQLRVAFSNTNRRAAFEEIELCLRSCRESSKLFHAPDFGIESQHETKITKMQFAQKNESLFYGCFSLRRRGWNGWRMGNDAIYQALEQSFTV